MALKVAELFAELGLDAEDMERDADRVITATSRDMRRIVDAAERAGTDAGRSLAEGLETALDRTNDIVTPEGLYTSRADFDRAGRQLGDDVKGGMRSSLDGDKLLSADAVRSSRADFEQAGREVGKGTGQGVGGGILDGMPDISAGLENILGDALDGLPASVGGPALAAGAAIGAAMVVGIQDALANEAINDALTARLDVSARQSDEFSRVTSSVYRAAWGDSTQEVADAIDSVYSTLGDSRQGEDALQRITEKALTFADVFQTDIDRAVSNAGVLISSGLAKDADEAFDLMVTGMQRVPRFVRDELQDAIQEYSVFFADLGYSGEEAMAMLVDSADRGTYAIDKTGDAIKELSLRAANVADTAAMDGLTQLGFNAEDMATRVATGGETAKAATQEIIAALDSVKDPAAQFAIATALMGAPIEDLGRQGAPELIAALQGMQGEIVDTTGAADDLTEAYENNATALTTIRRELGNLFTQYADKKLDPLGDLLQDKDKDLSDYGTFAGRTVGSSFMESLKLTVTGLPGALLPDDFWDKYGPKASWEAAMRGDWWFPDDKAAEVGQATGAAFAQGARDGARGGPPLLDLDAIAADAGPARASLEDINREIELSRDLFDLAADRAGNYLDRIAQSVRIDDMIAAQLDLRDSTEDLLASLSALQGVDIEGFATGTVQVSDEAAAALGNVAGAGQAAQQQIANALQWEGDASAIAKAGELRDRFVQMFDAAGMTDQQIIDLLASMGLMPEQVTTAIELSGVDEALAKLDLLQERFKGEVPEKIQTQIDIAMAEGRFEDAANLLSMWVKDREDGFLNDPLLVAIMANTDPATGEVDTWKAGEEGKPPTELPVGANTTPAQTGVQSFRDWVSKNGVTISVSTNLSPDARRVLDSVGGTAAFGAGGYGSNAPGSNFVPRGYYPGGVPRRAGGGPVRGPGGPRDDLVPIDASNGEWVIQASTANKFGPDVMAMINAGNLPTVPMPVGVQATGTGTDGALLAELRELRSSLGRPNVTIPTEIRTTAGPRETLAELSVAAEAGVIAAMGPG